MSCRRFHPHRPPARNFIRLVARLVQSPAGRKASFTPFFNMSGIFKLSGREMGETDTDAADQFNPEVAAVKLDEGLPGLWRRYRKLPRNVFAISLVSLLNDASSEIIYPLLPIFLSSTLGASARAIGIIEGSAESISSLLKLFAGYLSDRLRKRKLLVVSGYALATLV